jgi:uncharacterized protein
MRWLFALMLMLAAPLAAQTYPEFDRTTITDRADLLSDAEETALDQRLAQLRTETGIEFAVLTLPSQTPYAPDQTLETFATGLFNHWGIGNAERNDGILVLILSEDRAMRIELGEGYGRDWDRAAAEVINRSFLPEFENDNYAKGISDGVEDVIASIALPFRQGDAAPVSSEPDMTWIAVIGFALAALIVGRNRLADWMTRLRSCPKCGRRGLLRDRKTLRPASKSSKGEGRVTTHCRYCDYQDAKTFVIPMRSSSSSSGGSFGGGRSGGGGASGRW